MTALTSKNDVFLSAPCCCCAPECLSAPVDHIISGHLISFFPSCSYLFVINMRVDCVHRKEHDGTGSAGPSGDVEVPAESSQVK